VRGHEQLPDAYRKALAEQAERWKAAA
jgi:hypothetical protein